MTTKDPCNYIEDYKCPTLPPSTPCGDAECTECAFRQAEFYSTNEYCEEDLETSPYFALQDWHGRPWNVKSSGTMVWGFVGGDENGEIESWVYAPTSSRFFSMAEIMVVLDAPLHASD